MKTKFLLLLLALLPMLALAQNPRRPLKGILTNDSIPVEDVMVTNLSTKRMVNADMKGSFSIYAKTGDTLYFNSLTFRSINRVLTDDDMKQNPLVVKMDINVNTLEELKINQFTGDLSKDASKIKVETLNLRNDPDFKAYAARRTPVNGALPVTESQLQGIDLKAIGKAIGRVFSKPKTKKTDNDEVYGLDNKKTFTEVATTRFTEHFFIETLKIPENEIGRFLAFSDPGPENKTLLDPRNEFALTDYLVEKAKEYKQLKE